jgi:hypothetical protein
VGIGRPPVRLAIAFLPGGKSLVLGVFTRVETDVERVARRLGVEDSAPEVSTAQLACG